jgi:O-acetyl-ADP-ribose deacetylase (regulator of RNase III)
MALATEVGDVFNALVASKQRPMFVHGCNASGGFGSGVAGIVKKLYPLAELAYKQAYRRGGLKLGDVIVYDDILGKEPIICNAITQQYYGRDGKLYVDYDAVVVAMQAVATLAKKKGMHVHLPMIGGGLGGGDIKRLTAIFEACFWDVEATLWLKED